MIMLPKVSKVRNLTNTLSKINFKRLFYECDTYCHLLSKISKRRLIKLTSSLETRRDYVGVDRCNMKTALEFNKCSACNFKTPQFIIDLGGVFNLFKLCLP